MKNHFLKKNTAENRIRYYIFELMTHFEKLYDILNEMLAFSLSEEKTKDFFEEHFIVMEELHKELGKELDYLKKSTELESHFLYEAVRRTYNHLQAFNVLDLDKQNWAHVASMALPDKIYYRQIKLLVY